MAIVPQVDHRVRAINAQMRPRGSTCRALVIAAIPILAQNGRVLTELSKVLGMSRPEAAKWWAGIYSATLPNIRQRLATLTVKPEGSPDGEPIPLPWSYAEDKVLDHLELTHRSPQQQGEESLHRIFGSSRFGPKRLTRSGSAERFFSGCRQCQGIA
jgi:hypothetical protein